MNVLLLNVPWSDPDDVQQWGVRAGSRWPHMQTRVGEGAVPRYVPFPFFLAIAASRVNQAGHDVCLIDAVAEPCELSSLKERMMGFVPDVCFLEMSTPSLGADREALAWCHKHFPEALRLGGGLLTQEQAVQEMQTGRIDGWVGGEYDAVLADLVTLLAAGASDDQINQLPGVAFRSEPEVDDLAFVVDVSALPPPLYDALPMKHYGDPVCGLPAPQAQSWLSRGCPFRCSFCVWPQLMYGTRQYRAREIAVALDEVERLLGQYGCESFYFDDDTANVGHDRMLELAAAIVERGLDKVPWAMMARADLMDLEMIEALAGAGLYAIKYGVESAAPHLRNACNKATNWEKLEAALNWTQEAGVKMHLTFTLGLPGETETTIRETLAFAKAIAPESAQFSICTPFPGTSFYDECVSNGWLVTHDEARFLGSGEAVVDTPQLSASALSQSFDRVLHEWRSFTDERLLQRQKRLIQQLIQQTRQGVKWFFLGESAFAGFLFNSTNYAEVAVSRVDAPSAADVIVIVSKHDEEKLYRHARRQMGDKQYLRLFSV